jgi:hypothetical protein
MNYKMSIPGLCKDKNVMGDGNKNDLEMMHQQQLLRKKLHRLSGIDFSLQSVLEVYQNENSQLCSKNKQLKERLALVWKREDQV